MAIAPLCQALAEDKSWYVRRNAARQNPAPSPQAPKSPMISPSMPAKRKAARGSCEAAVRRYPELVLDLADFHSDAIDALAMKHLKNDEDRADYRRHEKEDRH